MFGFKNIEFKIAFRTLMSNQRRSILSIIIIAVGIASILFTAGYIEFVRIGFGNNLIENEYAHVQIYPKGFEIENDQYTNKTMFNFQEFEAIQDALYNDSILEHKLDFINPRVYLTGMAGNMNQSRIVLGIGGDPYAEERMKSSVLLKGSYIPASQSNAIVVGKGLATGFGYDVGDTLLFQIPDQSGFINADQGVITGIVDMGITELNNRYVLMHIDLARSLQGPEAAAQRVLLKFSNETDGFEDLEKLKPRILAALNKSGVDYEIKYWRDLAYYYNKVISLYSNQLILITSILLIVFIITVSNTLYMSIMQRQSEIGTLRAIGISQAEIMRVIFIEGFIMGITAMLVGILLAAGVGFLIQELGITQPPPPGLSKRQAIGVILTGSQILYVSVICVTATALATITPALQAVKKNIVEAIRTL